MFFLTLNQASFGQRSQPALICEIGSCPSSHQTVNQVQRLRSEIQNLDVVPHATQTLFGLKMEFDLATVNRANRVANATLAFLSQCETLSNFAKKTGLI